MARTRSLKKQQGEQITAAALPIYPKSPLKDTYGRNILDYVVNLSDGSDEVAWSWYRTIPELHYLVSLVGNAMSMVNLAVGISDPSDPEKPTSIGPRHPANDLMRSFAGGEAGQAELLNKLATHLTVVGDSIVIGPTTGQGLQYPYDNFRVYSTSEVSSRNGKVFVKGPNYRDEKIPDGAAAVRIWRQNPQEFWRADSPVKASFSVLHELDLLNKHVKSTAISRLKMAGIFVVPEEFTLPVAEVEVEGVDVDPFTAALTEVMQLAIANPESAAANVPIIMRGPAEFISAIRLVDFSTQFDSLVPDLRNNALRRLALGMDAPPEILLGSSEASSWSMWQISEAQLRLHIKPLAWLIADSLTEGWLKPALDALPLPDQTRESIQNLRIFPDFSNLQIRPDVGQDAAALYQETLITADAYRHILGLGENEAPTKEQAEEQILLRLISANPQLAPWAIKALNEDHGYSFPDPEGSMNVGTAGAEGEAEGQQGVGTPAAPGQPGTAPQIPGDRSQQRQTDAPSAPPIDGDESGNQSNSPT